MNDAQALEGWFHSSFAESLACCDNMDLEDNWYTFVVWPNNLMVMPLVEELSKILEFGLNLLRVMVVEDNIM